MVVNAIYEREAGKLRLLESLDLADGAAVQVTVMSEMDARRAALAGLVRFPDPNAEVEMPDMTEEEFMQLMDESFDPESLGSRYIIEDREDRV